MKRLSVILLFSFILLGILSCDNDKEASTNVTGVWGIESEVENSTDIQRLEYTFTANGQLEMVRFFIDKDRKFLGYRSKTTGNYTKSGNSLSFFDLTEYGNNDWETLYFPMDELTEIATLDPYNVTFTISENETELTIQYEPCGELENCIDKQTFLRSE